MFKFVIGAILLITIRAIAQPDATELLKNDASASGDKAKIIRTQKYIETINKVREAEGTQKKSILTQSNIVEAFKEYGDNDSHLNALNGILQTYAKLVKEGNSADEQTLVLAARKYIKLRLPFISESDLESKLDTLRSSPLIASGGGGLYRTTASAQKAQ